MAEENDTAFRLSRRALLQGVTSAGLASTLDPLANALGAPAKRQGDLGRVDNISNGR